MKKLIYILLALAFCAGCEKDIATYQGGSGIYFDTRDMYLDTIFVTWGLKNSDVTEQDLQLKVCLYGNTADYDRTFQVEVVAEEGVLGAKEGVDYLPVTTTCTLPANAAEAYVDLKLLRSDNLHMQPKRFTVKLKESDDLRFLYSRETIEYADENDSVGFIRPIDYQRVIYMDESFPMPGWWYVYGETIFGTWTATKASLICEVMDIDREEWIKSDGNGLSQGYLKFVGKYMYRWLEEHPQIDEDGKPMQMGTASQN